jgi:hypothetical protein
VLLTAYTGVVEMEALCMIDMMNQHVIPSMKAAGFATAELDAGVSKLKKGIKAIHDSDDDSKAADLARLLRLETMIAVRATCDEAEVRDPSRCLPHGVSHCISLAVSLTVSHCSHRISLAVSLTVFITVLPSLRLSLCLPHRSLSLLSRTASLTASPTVAPTVPYSPCLSLWLQAVCPANLWTIATYKELLFNDPTMGEMLYTA